MRIKTTKSKDEETIFEIKMGFSELLVIYELVRDTYKQFPKNFETSPFRNRLHTMQKSMGQEVQAFKAEHPGYDQTLFLRRKKL